jgi:hypothetical protein
MSKKRQPSSSIESVWMMKNLTLQVLEEDTSHTSEADSVNYMNMDISTVT